MTRVLSLVFIINAFSYVQSARLRKAMQFKTLIIIHLPSIVISGAVALAMAEGFWRLEYRSSADCGADCLYYSNMVLCQMEASVNL
jgi:hypothetical protein